MSRNKKKGRKNDSGKRKEERGGFRPTPPPESQPECPICSKKIPDLSTSVLHQKTKQPAHFDCVLTEIEKDENISPMEKLIYIGGGQFAVVNNLAYRNSKIDIVRKIKYEDQESKHASSIKEISVKVD